MRWLTELLPLAGHASIAHGTPSLKTRTGAIQRVYENNRTIIITSTRVLVRLGWSVLRARSVTRPVATFPFFEFSRVFLLCSSFLPGGCVRVILQLVQQNKRLLCSPSLCSCSLRHPPHFKPTISRRGALYVRCTNLLELVYAIFYWSLSCDPWKTAVHIFRPNIGMSGSTYLECIILLYQVLIPRTR